MGKNKQTKTSTILAEAPMNFAAADTSHKQEIMPLAPEWRVTPMAVDCPVNHLTVS